MKQMKVQSLAQVPICFKCGAVDRQISIGLRAIHKDREVGVQIVLLGGFAPAPM